MLFRLSLNALVLTLSASLLSAPSFGQEEKEQEKPPEKQAEKKQDAETPEFGVVFEKFQTLEDELDALEKQYAQATSNAEKRAIYKRYQPKVDELNKLLKPLRRAALAAYKAAPNESDDVKTTLVGMLANHIRFDEYDEALDIAKPLIDNDCGIRAVDLYMGIAAYCTNDFEAAGKHLEAAKESKVIDGMGSKYLDELDDTIKKWAKEKAARDAEKKADDLPRVRLTTSKGDIVVELFENEAPKTVANFVHLVEQEFYNGLTFHRVLASFMAQGGCPRGDGEGGPGYNIPCECYEENARMHFRGSLSMAHSGKDTGGSQFFLTFVPTTHLDGKHTVFGRVIAGHEHLSKLQRRDPDPRRQGQPDPDQIIKAEVIRKREHEYKPTKVEM
ncbi:MAG: peptidylprolyl isomerase [Pirellulaceae bacterium]|jgi:cyclophilin family peptidyl-prolyl cis-trans isomerase|nr:peptidylprolyl isomerase [Pirellulaceae bacterium]MDP7016717.1 peptidylprolyl isomerase [Pirellulaceae bacterium]